MYQFDCCKVKENVYITKKISNYVSNLNVKFSKFKLKLSCIACRSFHANIKHFILLYFISVKLYKFFYKVWDNLFFDPPSPPEKKHISYLKISIHSVPNITILNTDKTLLLDGRNLFQLNAVTLLKFLIEWNRVFN